MSNTLPSIIQLILLHRPTAPPLRPMPFRHHFSVPCPPSCALEDGAAALLAEGVVALLGEAAHQNILVLVHLAELHDLSHRLGDAHAVRRSLDAQLLHELTLHLQTFLELAHPSTRADLKPELS